MPQHMHNGPCFRPLCLHSNCFWLLPSFPLPPPSPPVSFQRQGKREFPSPLRKVTPVIRDHLGAFVRFLTAHCLGRQNHSHPGIQAPHIAKSGIKALDKMQSGQTMRRHSVFKIGWAFFYFHFQSGRTETDSSSFKQHTHEVILR